MIIIPPGITDNSLHLLTDPPTRISPTTWFPHQWFSVLPNSSIIVPPSTKQFSLLLIAISSIIQFPSPVTSHLSCQPSPPSVSPLLARYRCNWTFPLVFRSSASSSSIFYVSWPAETSSCRDAWYDTSATTFLFTRPCKQRPCYSTSDNQCSHCSGMSSVNGWLGFPSSLLNTSLGEEIHTNRTESNYAHSKIHVELKIYFFAIYFCFHVFTIIEGKRPFETSSRSVLKKTRDFFEQLVCYIIKLFTFGEKGVQCKRCNVKELKWEMDLSRNYGVLWMEDNTSPLYFQELGRNLAKKKFFFRCRKSQLAV